VKVLVTGSREWHDPAPIWRVLDDLCPSHVIHGAAEGVDTIAGQWAICNRVRVSAYPADWGNDGLAAGPKRNQRMLELHPDIGLVLAFPLKWSIGTRDMMRRARLRGVPVLEWVGCELLEVHP
jgi:hypothetical protein